MSKVAKANPVTGQIEMPKDFDGFDVPSRKHEVLGVIASIFALALLLAR